MTPSQALLKSIQEAEDAKRELQLLKYWVDSEFTILHIGIYVILGVVIDKRTAWYPLGALVIISIVYMLKRTAKLPKGYLDVKKESK